MVDLEKEIIILENRIKLNSDADSQVLEKLQLKKKEFENIQEDEVRGIMIRTKAKWLSEG